MPHHITPNPVAPGSSALDFTQLHQLRRQVHTPTANGAAQAEAEVARQFEALFIAQLLKQTRQASEASGMSFFDSPQTQMVQSMGDAQLAQQLATPGMGLAQVLLAQMRRAAGNVLNSDAPPGTAASADTAQPSAPAVNTPPPPNTRINSRAG